MTQQEILRTAMRQSAVDLGCEPEDFTKSHPVIVPAAVSPDARKYLSLPYPAYFVSYGHNITASVIEPLREIAADYLNRYPASHCFEPPHLHALHEALAPFGFGVCFTAEYWLPELRALQPLPCDFSLRVMTQADFAPLYLPQWSNALCQKRAELDILGVGAYDGETLVGLAGCSADCADMWQIGVDVLPEYRHRGIASALTSRLAIEILNRDKVPFYCCAWCNLPSARNAVRSGFRPAWTEMEADSLEKIAEMNTGG
ncbi:MAG: GNAT family N-acetyltransferase [Oscillospiraceae bacterium]|nr:GNAT family N-acetyltransferase [Oscillospiraceae bacterium]